MTRLKTNDTRIIGYYSSRIAAFVFWTDFYVLMYSCWRGVIVSYRQDNEMNILQFRHQAFFISLCFSTSFVSQAASSFHVLFIHCLMTRELMNKDDDDEAVPSKSKWMNREKSLKEYHEYPCHDIFQLSYSRLFCWTRKLKKDQENHKKGRYAEKTGNTISWWRESQCLIMSTQQDWYSRSVITDEPFSCFISTETCLVQQRILRDQWSHKSL